MLRTGSLGAACARPLIVLFIVCAVLAAAPVYAQSGYRGYALAGGGGTFADEPKPALGFEFGQRVHPNIDAYLTFQWLQDITSTSQQNEWNALSDALTTATGVSWQLQSQVEALTGVAGAKLHIGHGRVRPYAVGGLGYAHLDTKIREVHIGDVTSSLAKEDLIPEDRLSHTNFMGEAGAGAAFIVGGSGYIDLSYRYRRTFDTSYKFGGFYMGFGVRY